MNKYNKPNTTSGTAKTINPARNSGPNIASPTVTQSERMPDPDAVAREAAKKGQRKDQIKAPAKKAVKEPLSAAKGDDDIMSQEPRKV